MIDQFHFSQNLLNFILPVVYIQRHESILEVTKLYVTVPRKRDLLRNIKNVQ